MESPGVGIGSESILLLTYISALFLTGLLTLVVVTRAILREPASRRLSAGVWPVKPVDFAFLLLLLLLGLMLVGELVHRVDGVIGMERIQVDALAGILSQVVLVGFFLGFRRYVASGRHVLLSPVKTRASADLQRGLLMFLASVPLVWCVTLLWMAVAAGIGSLGYELPLTEQTIVRYFLETDSPLLLGILAVLAVVGAPIAEELVFRAGIYRFLKSYLPVSLAMVISSAVFSALHFNLLNFPSLIALGVLLCLSYELSGSIRVPIFFHAFFNLNSVLMLCLQAQG